MSVLNEPCLILNRNWQPITFLPIQTSICTVMRDMGSVIHPESFEPMNFDHWSELTEDDLQGFRWIKTSNKLIAVPELVVLKKYGERPPRKIGFNRPNLARRDDYMCQYCGKIIGMSKLQVEHVIPRSRGGPTTWENCVAACGDCNSRKADKTPAEAKMRLRKEPHRPRWNPRLRAPQGILRPSWEPFLKAEGVVA